MRLKTLTLTGAAAADPNAFATSQITAELDADDDGIAAAQTPVLAADPNGIALDQALTEDTALALEAGADALNPPRQLTLTSGDDLSAIDFEIVGLDENGDPQTVPAFAGPNNETVTTAEYWSSITSITPDATSSDTVEAGWPNTLEPLTLEAGVDELDPPRRITLTSGAAADFSGVAFTIVGTDANGNPQNEVIAAGPDNDTVSGALLFGGVTAIIPDPTAAVVSADVSAGWPITGGSALTDGLTLEEGAAAISPAREITLTATGVDLSDVTFRLVGLDRWQNPIEEIVTGPNNETVRSKKIFSVLTQVIPSEATDLAVEVGFDARVCSVWLVNGSRYANQQPVANLQAALVPGEAFGACIVETTNENVLRISGEGADAGTVAEDDLDNAGDVRDVTGANLRVVMVADTGAARIHVARPGV